MAKQPTPSKKTATKSRSSVRRPARSGAGKWIWIVLGVVVVAFVVIVLVSRGDDKAAATGQTQPVTVRGTALPEYTGPASPDPAIGTTAPDLTGTSFAGKPVTITNDGTAKVVIFAAHWCPHCQREIPLLAAQLQGKPMPEDVQLFLVSTSVNPDAPNYPPDAWLDGVKWPSPVLADSKDGDAAKAFGLRSFPYFVAVDAQGKVVQRATGEISMPQFEALVTAAQTGKPQAGA